MIDGIVVLGMHRSGTSAITRVLNLLGPSLGRECDLYWAEDNPSGHWESRELIRCNDELLAAFGGNWMRPPRLEDGWADSAHVDRLLPRLVDTFDGIYGNVPRPWLWKDPRACLTLPVWRRVFGDNILAVLVLRQPAYVARSLQRRDAIPVTYGLALWAHYTHSAIKNCAGLSVLVVNYDELSADPGRGLDALVEDFGELGIELAADSSEALESFRPAKGVSNGRRRWMDMLTRRTLQAAHQLDRVDKHLTGHHQDEPMWVQLMLSAVPSRVVLAKSQARAPSSEREA